MENSTNDKFLGNLVITKPLNELKANHADGSMISILKKPYRADSCLRTGMYCSVRHKTHEGESIYFLEGVPFGIGESDLMLYEETI